MDNLRTLLKRDESYAIHILINVAENPGTNAATIARHLQMPPSYIPKVLRALTKVNLVDSRVGRGGGVYPTIDLDRVSVLDVIETMSGQLVFDPCQSRARCATQERKGYCRLNVAWLRTTLAIRDLLAGVKLSELRDEAGDAGAPPP